MKKLNYSFPLERDLRRDKVFYGTLTPTDWDEDDRPTEFSIFTYDEEDILLGSPHLKKKYLKYINQPVEITGSRRVNEYGDEYIAVKRIKRIRRGESKFLSKMIGSQNPISIEEYFPFHQKSFSQGIIQGTA